MPVRFPIFSQINLNEFLMEIFMIENQLLLEDRSWASKIILFTPATKNGEKLPSKHKAS